MTWGAVVAAEGAGALAACCYDLDPTVPDDLPFWEGIVPPGIRLLELGCGTGRALLHLAPRCRRAIGIDRSPDMLALCRTKAGGLRELSDDGLRLLEADLARFELDETVDLAIAPYRVFQQLVDEAAVAGMFRSVAGVLGPGGSLVLTAARFRPELDETWPPGSEIHCWRVARDGTAVTCRATKRSVDGRVEDLRLVYDVLPEGAEPRRVAVDLALRRYRAAELEAVVAANGFRVTGRWGGYEGEEWGEGPELVVRCTPEGG